MNIYPTTYEIFYDTAGDELLGKLEAFDEECFALTIDGKIVSPKDLRALADKMEKALALLKDGAFTEARESSDDV